MTHGAMVQAMLYNVVSVAQWFMLYLATICGRQTDVEEAFIIRGWVLDRCIGRQKRMVNFPPALCLGTSTRRGNTPFADRIAMHAQMTASW